MSTPEALRLASRAGRRTTVPFVPLLALTAVASRLAGPSLASNG
jgi:hypothetical protein